jgi:hypothetical protein
MRLSVALLGLLFLACSNLHADTSAPTPRSPQASSTSQPSATTVSTAARVALLLDADRSNFTKPSFTVTLVSLDGKVVGKAATNGRPVPGLGSAGLMIPEFPLSVTGTRAYFLDGAATVRFLDTSGASGLAIDLVPGTDVVIGFAVSPDDRQIAYTLEDISAGPRKYGLRLLVRSLSGGAPAELYSTSCGFDGHPLWPVLWNSAGLDVAVGGGAGTQNGVFVHGYHVVDPVTANRLVTIAPDCNITDAWSWAPPARPGPVCLTDSGLTGFNWAGTPTTFPFSQEGFFQLRSSSLAPDGRSVIVCCPVNGQGGAPPPHKGPLIVDTAGGLRELPEAGDGSGWLDADHVLLAALSGNDSILTLSSGVRMPVEARGQLYGVVATS